MSLKLVIALTLLTPLVTASLFISGSLSFTDDAMAARDEKEDLRAEIESMVDSQEWKKVFTELFRKSRMT